MAIIQKMRGEAPVEFEETDTGRRVAAGPSPDVVVRGSASDLLLLLYQRRSVADLHVDGNAARLDNFLGPIE